MRNKHALVSIIVVNWNGGKVLEECLASIAKITYANWELAAVDNGSTDGSVRAIRNAKRKTQNAKVKVIQNSENVGFAKANNQGYKVAKGEYILLLNNDTKVEPDFLEKMVERMEKEEEIGVIQPKIFLMDKKGYLDNAGSFLTRIGFLEHWGFGEKDGPEFEKEREIFSAKGACMLIRRKVIEKVGLFDDDFVSYFEESDFCWRVWLAGYRVLFYPQARIYHKVGFTIRRLDVWGNNYHYYKNRICALLKNLEVKNFVWMLPLHLMVSLGIAAAFLVKGQVGNTVMIIKAWGWNLRDLPRTLERRRKVQKVRKVSDKELFDTLMHPVNWSGYLRDFKRVEEDLRREV